ncbi:MAG TPA: ABC-F type ribosomal protection protein [Clostridiales bacterium UBA8960]|nr:ABC-F type ribosomal protection protein [Clostridiales bacterium UBA8960]
MSQIKISQLTFAYEGSYDNVFENVSFQIDTNWKLGFTGRNGRGKTTFLKLLMGEYPYQGKIHASVTFDYFPYIVPNNTSITEEVVASIYPNYEYWAICKELSLLDLDESILQRSFETLSQGEKTKVLLAILFLRHNHFLLIDEPTNHLDLEGRACVANYLKKKKGFILVSHDRLFLDHIIDHVLSINKTNIEIQKGNFSSWMKNKHYQDQFELAENEKLVKDIKRLGDSAKRTAGWSNLIEKSKFNPDVMDRGFVGHKAAKMMKRAKAIEQRREKAIEEKQKLLKNIESADHLEIKHEAHFAEVLLSMDNLSLSYGDVAVIKGFNLKLERGSRLAIVGGNGSGKSSLVKAILGVMGTQVQSPEVVEGQIKVAKDLKVSYVSQDTSMLVGSLREFALDRGIDEGLLKSILAKLDFNTIQFEKELSNLSEGQKKKVLLAASICDRAHLYIWDEPLNYVDILSRIQIEDMIKAYEPTLIFIEHDQAFIEDVATDVINVSAR